MLPLDHESEDFDISELGLSCWMEALWETQERSSGTISTGSFDRSPKRRAPGRRRLAETVFLHEFIRGNSRPVKTEYVRIKVIRGHKRWLRKLDLEVMDRQIQKCLGTSQGFWLKQLLDTYQLKSLDGLLEAPVDVMAIVKDNDTGRLMVKVTAEDQMDFDNFAIRDSYDRVLRCLGWTFDDAIFNRCVRH